MTGNTWLRIAAVLGLLAVGLGAFGAHGLKARLEGFGTTAVYQTAVQYHMFHALALLAVAVAMGPGTGSWTMQAACWGFLVGLAIFSGSLYVLAVTNIRWLGAITPIGGVAMLAGWLALASSSFHHAPAKPSPTPDPLALMESHR